MKKALSLILCLAMLLTAALPLASAEERSGKDVPIVYIQGQGSDILDAEGKAVYPTNLPDGYLTDAVADCLPYFKDAILSDKWDEYHEKLAEWLYPAFEKMQLDCNGEPSDGSHVWWNWQTDNVADQKTAAGYEMLTYSFRQDWRLDPVDNAKLLKGYIERVKASTGSDKVNLVGRCEGANILIAYLAEYGHEDIHSIELYVPSIKGVESVSALFSGNLYMDAESINRFFKDGKIEFNGISIAIDDPVISEFIVETLRLTSETYLLDAGSFLLDVVLLKKLNDEVLSDMILHSYGTFPGIWSLVTPNDFNDALENMFPTDELKQQYAGLIQKVTYYNDNVRAKSDKLLKDAEADGVKVAVFAKYGDFKTLPISYYSNNIGDGVSALGIVPGSTLNVKYGGTSLGATTARAGKILTNKQIINRKYLSPDKKVDCSTCLFPDTTWVIYNCEHRCFPYTIDDLMLKFFRSNGEMTVFSDPSAPQFVKSSDAYDNYYPTISPMTADDYKEPEKDPLPTKESFLAMLKAFFLSLVALIKQLLKK